MIREAKDFMDTSRQCCRDTPILADFVTMRRAAAEIIMVVGLSGSVWLYEGRWDGVDKGERGQYPGRRWVHGGQMKKSVM
mmetsp:Transcript_21913/g.46073  ORF Transcript_21913/g.46073 Transcript_21913/m.46073 type:complete len:80 (-) Transcript_21913:53-292(-)